MTEQVYIVSRDGKRIGITRESEAMGGLAWFHANVHAYSSAHAIAHEGYSVEAAEPDCSDVAALIEGIAERLGIAADFEFVPFSRSRNVAMESFTGEPWQSLNWRVTVKQRGRTIRTTGKASAIVRRTSGNGIIQPRRRGQSRWKLKPARSRALACSVRASRSRRLQRSRLRALATCCNRWRSTRACSTKARLSNGPSHSATAATPAKRRRSGKRALR